MKIKINGQRYSSTFMALLFLVAAVLACSSGDETEKGTRHTGEDTSGG